MPAENEKDRDEAAGGREARWRIVYASVIAFTAFVIAALWWFSRAFSS